MRGVKLPVPPDEYDPELMRQLVNTLVLWSNQFAGPVSIIVQTIDAKQLPTVADLADLPSGAVYTDGTFLMVKP